MNSGAVRKKIFDLLKSPDFAQKQDLLRELPFHRVLNALFSAFCSVEEEIKWHAVTVTGFLVADLAERDTEGARNILRRMIWSLNEESGGIGWGIPEAMGEILARDERLAREFAFILVSHLRPDGNFLEFELLQRGTLWAIGRLAEVHPDLVQSLEAARYLLAYLHSSDDLVRGHAAWALGRVRSRVGLSQLEILLRDEAEIMLYQDQKFRAVRVRDLAREALMLIKRGYSSPPSTGP